MSNIQFPPGGNIEWSARRVIIKPKRIEFSFHDERSYKFKDTDTLMRFVAKADRLGWRSKRPSGQQAAEVYSEMRVNEGAGLPSTLNRTAMLNEYKQKIRSLILLLNRNDVSGGSLKISIRTDITPFAVITYGNSSWSIAVREYVVKAVQLAKRKKIRVYVQGSIDTLPTLSQWMGSRKSARRNAIKAEILSTPMGNITVRREMTVSLTKLTVKLAADSLEWKPRRQGDVKTIVAWAKQNGWNVRVEDREEYLMPTPTMNRAISPPSTERDNARMYEIFKSNMGDVRNIIKRHGKDITATWQGKTLLLRFKANGRLKAQPVYFFNQQQVKIADQYLRRNGVHIKVS